MYMLYLCNCRAVWNAIMLWFNMRQWDSAVYTDTDHIYSRRLQSSHSVLLELHYVDPKNTEN